MTTLDLREPARICFTYVNWRGERGLREAEPIEIFFGSTKFHSDTQWIMRAWDVDKNAPREFAMKDMSDIVELST